MIELKGLNPDKVQGHILRPIDMKVYVVPDRALEVLDVLIDEKPVMFRNPNGHRSSSTYKSHGLLPLDHIEGAFTAGVENVGGPNENWPLHGTFSVTPAVDVKFNESHETVTGKIFCERMVTGPNIIVHRTVEPINGKRAFLIKDDLEATLNTYFMWLYHPNFPVQTGTKFYSSETAVFPRDRISAVGAEDYRTFRRVGRGVTSFPPSVDTVAKINNQNFEKCYIMHVIPDSKGNVYAMLISEDGNSAAYIRYKPEHFQDTQQAFQLWKNPRDGSCGLEVGSTFRGRTYANEHGLLCYLKKGNTQHYEIEIGFLISKAEVNDLTKRIKQHRRSILTSALNDDDLAQVYHQAINIGGR